MTQPAQEPFAIRIAEPADAEVIYAFIKELAEYEKLAHEVTATRDQIAESLFGARAYAEVLLAERDGEPVGFALFFHNYSTFRGAPGIYLEDLFVKPEYRGQGLGRALFQALAKLAVQRGCARMDWAVLDWNEPAIGFYRRLGAIPLDEWTVNRLTGDALQQLADA